MWLEIVAAARSLEIECDAVGDEYDAGLNFWPRWYYPLVARGRLASDQQNNVPVWPFSNNNVTTAAQFVATVGRSADLALCRRSLEQLLELVGGRQIAALPGVAPLARELLPLLRRALRRARPRILRSGRRGERGGERGHGQTGDHVLVLSHSSV